MSVKKGNAERPFQSGESEGGHHGGQQHQVGGHQKDCPRKIDIAQFIIGLLKKGL